MTLSLCASFAFDLEHDADALLQFEIAALPGQRLIDATTTVSAAQSLNRVPAQDSIGERIWIHAEGTVEVRYEAHLAFDRVLTPLAPLRALRPHRLPGEAVKYLLDSRYCHPAQFVAFTEEQFGPTRGGARVEAIRDWVAGHIAYTPGASASDTTATDTFHSAQGICRDYAHLFVTLARASAIPARYVACYAPGVEPQDFHAVCEVFLADPADETQGEIQGSWHLVDPTGMADLSRAAIIGVGRDAGDVSFLTSFGPMRFLSSEVRVLTGAEDAEAAKDTPHAGTKALLD